MGPGERLLIRTALIPIRDFEGMTRLDGALNPKEREDLSRDLADLALAAVADTTMSPIILTSDAEVRTWAAGSGVRVITDAGIGLSASVTNAISEHALPDWLVTHADMPFVTAHALSNLAEAASASGHALAPSVDGGTNAIAGTGPFRFSYGPASFHRHLSAAPAAAVISDPALAIEIDTEMHLRSVRNLPLPSSLRP
jgi:2-phospho-L-lactate guanylyltransferase